MAKTILWIDDNAREHEAAGRMLAPLEGLTCIHATSSDDARHQLEMQPIQAVVTDILRRDSIGHRRSDDGYDFVHNFVRPRWPSMPVIFHTKNLPRAFSIDAWSQYLSKWEPEEKKSIELERRLSEAVNLYEAFADSQIWTRIEPRLTVVRGQLLARLEKWSDVWSMTPSQFEELIADLLQELKFSVLWIPGGNDQGIDIIASSDDSSYLIDVKRYAPGNSVGVELVRHVYGVASAVQDEKPKTRWYGGIITSSRFTSGADDFRKSARVRPLLRDGEWLKANLEQFVPYRTVAT